MNTHAQFSAVSVQAVQALMQDMARQRRSPLELARRLGQVLSDEGGLITVQCHLDGAGLAELQTVEGTQYVAFPQPGELQVAELVGVFGAPLLPPVNSAGERRAVFELEHPQEQQAGECRLVAALSPFQGAVNTAHVRHLTILCDYE